MLCTIPLNLLVANILFELYLLTKQYNQVYEVCGVCVCMRVHVHVCVRRAISLLFFQEQVDTF